MLKQAARRLIVLLFSLPVIAGYRDRLLRGWSSPPKNTADAFFFRIISNAWLAVKYYGEKDPEMRLARQHVMMGGESGSNWAAHYNSRAFPPSLDEPIGCMTARQAFPLFGDLERHLDDAKEPALLIQIGSSSGRQIAWYARRFSRHQFLGTDVMPSAIEFSRRTHNFSNLEFATLPAHYIPSALHVAHQRVILFSEGSMQYVQPEHLDFFFSELSKLPNIELFLQEPTSELEGPALDIAGSIPRGGMSWAHNYAFYARKHGLPINKAEIIRPFEPPEKYPSHAHFAHYYFTSEKVGENALHRSAA